MTTTCVLGHAWKDSWVLCPTCGFGRRALPVESSPAHQPVAEAVHEHLREVAHEQVLVPVGGGAAVEAVDAVGAVVHEPAPAAAGVEHHPASVVSEPAHPAVVETVTEPAGWASVPSTAAEPAVEPILSPDGNWAWDGAGWVPAARTPQPVRVIPVQAIPVSLPAAEPVEVASAVAAPAETTAPLGTTAPAETTGHVETTAPAEATAHSEAPSPAAEVAPPPAIALAHIGSDPAAEADATVRARRGIRRDHPLLLGGIVVLAGLISSDIAFGLPPLGHKTTAAAAVTPAVHHVRAATPTGRVELAPDAVVHDLTSVSRAEAASYRRSKAFTASPAALVAGGATTSTGDRVLVAASPSAYCVVAGSGRTWYVLGSTTTGAIGTTAYGTAVAGEQTCAAGVGAFRTVTG